MCVAGPLLRGRALSTLFRGPRRPPPTPAETRALCALLDALPGATLAVGLDQRVIGINAAGCRLFGVEVASALGVDLAAVAAAAGEEQAAVLQGDVGQVMRPGPRTDASQRLLRLPSPDRETVFEARVAPTRDADGHIDGAVVTLRDVGAQREAQERWGDVHDDVGGLLAVSLDPMLVVDPSGRVVDLNAALARLVGRGRHELLGCDCAALFSDSDALRGGLQDVFGGGKPRFLAQGLLGADGKPIDVACNVAAARNARGEPTFAFVVVRDLSDLRVYQAHLEFQATYDVLTALPNRALFRANVEEALQRSRQSGQLGAVMFIDLDNFKDVNDTLGHSAGDELLKAIGGRLAASVRESDVVARIGGDEFALLIEQLADLEDARHLAEQLLAVVGEPISIGGVELVVGCSIGITVFPRDIGGPDTLLRNADTALFRAKDVGKNNSQFFTYEMNRAVRRRVEIGTQLRNAIRLGEFSVVYQPRMGLVGDQLAGVEALLRWNNPELGAVSPQEFIPVAEETGLIVPIGEWVLRQACRQAVQWHEASGREVAIAVNISARQFRGTDIVKTVMDALAETGLSNRLLELELTESVLMHDTTRAVETLTRLAEAGVRVALDDFGTGYSSLGYLKRFPIDSLKVDRSFVADITRDAHDEAIVTTIVALAHGLGMRVVAEGVETREQLALLRRLNCDEVQGYLLGRPMPAEQLLALLLAAEPGELGNSTYSWILKP
jgi:diguanylate cyclase (GGDEF)-like protein/PAS domain S-box-containing protein